jgi:AcrR family transcriptional regulator
MNEVGQTGVRAQQKAATREAVLAAARDEFEAVGFEAANVRSIAHRAGVSAGTVLHHFGEKRDLLHAALFDDLEATLSRALARVGHRPLAKEASALGGAVFGYYQKRPALSRALLKESLFAEGPWAKGFVTQAQRVHQALAGLARREVEAGRLDASVSPDVVAAAWLSFFYFALIGWVQGANPTPLAFTETLFAQHLEGLTPRRKP